MAMSKTNIEWTDVSWNPVTGCSKVSEGCRNCYAERIMKRFEPDRKFTDVKLHEDRLRQPLHWKKPRMVFVNSMSDLFHKAVPDEFIDKVFAVMALRPQHTFQILTKRPQRMRGYLSNQVINRGFGGAQRLRSLVHSISQDMCNQLKDGRRPAMLEDGIKKGDWFVPRSDAGIPASDGSGH